VPENELSVIRTEPNKLLEAFSNVGAVADIVDSHSQKLRTRVSEEQANGFGAIGVSPVGVGEDYIFGALQFGMRVAQHLERIELLTRESAGFPYDSFGRAQVTRGTMLSGRIMEGHRLAACAVVRILSNSFDPCVRVVAKHCQIAETPRWEQMI
jgi:hypothetical protein